METSSGKTSFPTAQRLRWLASKLKLPRPVFEVGLGAEVRNATLNQAVQNLEDHYGTGVLADLRLETAFDLDLQIASSAVRIIGRLEHPVLPTVVSRFEVPAENFVQLFFRGEDFQSKLLRQLLRDMVAGVWRTYDEKVGLTVRQFRDTPSFPLFNSDEDPGKVLFSDGNGEGGDGGKVSFRRFIDVKTGRLDVSVPLLESTLLFEAGRTRDALERISVMISDQKEINDPGVLNTLSQILIGSGEVDKAIKYLSLILDRNPANADANFLLGKIYLKLSVDNPELIKKAHKHLKGAVQSRPGNLEYQFVFALALARIYGRTDKRTLAVNYYKKMLQYSRPDCQLATMMEYDLGKLLFRIGGYREAAEHFARINNYYRTYRVLPTNSVYVESSDPNEILAEVNLFAATCYRQLGETDKALDYSRRVMEVAPESPLAFFEQGLILKTEGKYEEAIASFETSLEKSPSMNLKAELGYHLAEAYLYLIKILGDDPTKRLSDEDWGKRAQAMNYFRFSLDTDPQGDNREKILELVGESAEARGDIGKSRFITYFRSLMDSDSPVANQLLLLLCESIFLPAGSASPSGQALQDTLVYLRDRLPGASQKEPQTSDTTRARDLFLRLAEISYYYDGPSVRVALALDRFLKNFAPKYPQNLHYPTVNGMINYMNQEELYRVIPKAHERSLAKVLLGGRLSTRYLIFQNCSKAKGDSLIEEIEVLQGKARVPDRESERDLEQLIVETVYHKEIAKIRQEGITLPSGEIYYMHGLSLLAAGRYDRAVRAFSRAPEFLDSVEPELEAASFEYLQAVAYIQWCRDQSQSTQQMRLEMVAQAKALLQSALKRVEDERLKSQINARLEEVANLVSPAG